MYSYADIFFVAGMTWGIVACALILIALFFVRSGNILMHKRVMLLMLGGGWAFVLFYLVGYLFDQSYSKSAPSYFLPWLAAHGVVARVFNSPYGNSAYMGAPQRSRGLLGGR